MKRLEGLRPQANLAAGFKDTPNNYTWHHHEEGRLCQDPEKNGSDTMYGGKYITIGGCI
ncbi:HNH endonuclease [Candidatus Jidaibacter acanthamoebae]|nr:HNH endonuclease [Candidatus Jidaibacter acanthamoeba]